MEIEKSIYNSPRSVIITLSNKTGILIGSPHDDGGMEEGGEIIGYIYDFSTIL